MLYFVFLFFEKDKMVYKVNRRVFRFNLIIFLKVLVNVNIIRFFFRVRLYIENGSVDFRFVIFFFVFFRYFWSCYNLLLKKF